MPANNIIKPGYILKSPVYSYRIEKVLGTGGFGITYLASASIKVGNVSARINFAVKEHFMSSDCERDGDTYSVIYSKPAKERVENSRKDFISEANRLRKVGVGHDNLVKVNEVFEANNTAYYVMEYLDGVTLREYVKKRGALSEDEMLAVMNPVIEVVKYLHQNRMTHLDIKPDNIMITHDENGCIRPVLIDFGLSKHYDRDGKPTSTINVLGCSDGYAPIEQYAGVTTFSPASDIYALGATMWFCLTGKDPQKSTDLNDGELVEKLPDAISNETKSLIENTTRLSKNNRSFSFVTTLPVNIENSSNHTDSSRTKEINRPIQDDGKSDRIHLKRYLYYIGVALLIVIAYIVGKNINWTHDGAGSTSNDVAQDSVSEIQESPVSPKVTPIPSDFILVPGGTLKNVHEVTTSDHSDLIIYDLHIDSLYMSKYELTQQEYKRTMGAISDSQMTYEVWEPQKKFILKGDSLPVRLLLREAIDYCNKRSEIEGYDGFYKFNGDTITIDVDGNGYRLPHHMEWLFAARGGDSTQGYSYSGSNKLKEVGWYAGNSGMKPHNVGLLKPNELGLYDMTGNICEFNGTSGEFDYWHTPMFTNEAYFSFNLPLKGVFNKDHWKDYSEWREGVRLVLIPRNVTNRNLLLKSRKKQPSEYW